MMASLEEMKEMKGIHEISQALIILYISFIFMYIYVCFCIMNTVGTAKLSGLRGFCIYLYDNL